MKRLMVAVAAALFCISVSAQDAEVLSCAPKLSYIGIFRFSPAVLTDLDCKDIDKI